MKIKIIIFLLISLFSYELYSNENIKINGNDYIDDEVIISIIDEYIDDLSDNNLNQIIKKLEANGLFETIDLFVDENILNINLTEKTRIKDISFVGNDRFNSEKIFEILNKKDYLLYYDENNIDYFVNELKNLYLSFGYNKIDISYNVFKNIDNKFLDIEFKIIEGKISKINNIYFIGNNVYPKNTLMGEIESIKRNILKFKLNSNFKLYQSQKRHN